MFQQGGPAMYQVLYLGAPALVIALLHAVAPRKWSMWTGAGIVALFVIMAGLGWHQSRSRTDEYIERELRDPESRNPPGELELKREQGYLEARRPLQFAGIAAAACLLPLLVGEIRRRRR